MYTVWVVCIYSSDFVRGKGKCSSVCIMYYYSSVCLFIYLCVDLRAEAFESRKDGTPASSRDLWFRCRFGSLVHMHNESRVGVTSCPHLSSFFSCFNSRGNQANGIIFTQSSVHGAEKRTNKRLCVVRSRHYTTLRRTTLR